MNPPINLPIHPRTHQTIHPPIGKEFLQNPNLEIELIYNTFDISDTFVICVSQSRRDYQLCMGTSVIS